MVNTLLYLIYTQTNKWTVSFKRQFYMDVLEFLLIKYFIHNIIALKLPQIS